MIVAKGFYLKVVSPYGERLNSSLSRLMAFGLFEKWNKDIMSDIIRAIEIVAKVEKKGLSNNNRITNC